MKSVAPAPLKRATVRRLEGVVRTPGCSAGSSPDLASVPGAEDAGRSAAHTPGEGELGEGEGSIVDDFLDGVGTSGSKENSRGTVGVPFFWQFGVQTYIPTPCTALLKVVFDSKIPGKALVN